MACNSCGGSSSPVRIERTSTDSRSLIMSTKVKAPLRPRKVFATPVRAIRPANHLDDRM